MCASSLYEDTLLGGRQSEYESEKSFDASLPLEEKNETLKKITLDDEEEGHQNRAKPFLSTMLVRPFIPSDLLAFNAVNLDYYTETVRLKG